LSRKKILLIGPAYPYRGGNPLYVSFVYDILKDYFDIKIINYKLLYPSILFPGTTQKDVSGKTIKNVPSIRLINSINPFSWLKTANFIKEQNADLVIFDWWNPFFGPSHYSISKLIKKKYKNKILFITENVISHEGRFIDRFLTKLGLKNANYYLALSNIVENDLKKLYAKPVYRSELPIYDGYSFNEIFNQEKEKENLGYKKDDIVILFFGYVRKYKGLSILIDSIPEVVSRNSKIKFLVVGEFYDSYDKYLNQIDKLKIKENIKVLNKFVPNEDVGKYYSAADLVALPYLSATQSGILNIAYGFRKPVIVTRVGGLADDVIEGETGFVVEPQNPYEIANKIQYFAEKKDKINFKSNIEKKIKNHKFNEMPKLIGEIIENKI
jgi:glycosyltransferase involved in cell wall biosynthesis